jgi:ankyrin repeat protein
MYACQAGSLQIVKLLFEKSDNYEEGKKIEVDLQNDEGDTALMVACSFDFHENQDKIVKLLLEKGANVNLENNQGETPIELCIITEFKDGLQALLDYKGKGALTRETLDTVYKKVLEEYDFESETIDLLHVKKNKNLSRLADLALIEASWLKTLHGEKWPDHIKQMLEFAKQEADKQFGKPANGGRRTKSISGRSRRRIRRKSRRRIRRKSRRKSRSGRRTR